MPGAVPGHPQDLNHASQNLAVLDCKNGSSSSMPTQTTRNPCILHLPAKLPPSLPDPEARQGVNGGVGDEDGVLKLWQG